MSHDLEFSFVSELNLPLNQLEKQFYLFYTLKLYFVAFGIQSIVFMPQLMKTGNSRTLRDKWVKNTFLFGLMIG